MSDLDLVFDETPVAAEVEKVEQVEQVEQVAVEEPANTEVEADSQEEEAKTEEPTDNEVKEETTTSEDKDVEKAWTKAMALDERRKRQDTQKEFDDYKAQMEVKAKAPAPDVFDDQEAFTNHLHSEVDQKLMNQKVEMSRDFMLDTHSDYEDMEKAFLELAQTTPGLREQAAAHPMPAKYVYEQGKRHLQFQEMQDTGKYEAKIRAEIRAEIEAENNNTQKVKAAKADNITPSLANARASDTSKPQEVTLDTLFKT